MRRGTSDTWKFHALLPRVAGKTLAEGHLLFLLVVCTCSVLSQDYDGFGGLNNWSNYTDRRDEDESNRLYSISAAAIFILKFIISAGPGSHKAASVIIRDVTTMRAVEGF